MQFNNTQDGIKEKEKNYCAKPKSAMGHQKKSN